MNEKIRVMERSRKATEYISNEENVKKTFVRYNELLDAYETEWDISPIDPSKPASFKVAYFGGDAEFRWIPEKGWIFVTIHRSGVTYQEFLEAVIRKLINKYGDDWDDF